MSVSVLRSPASLLLPSLCLLLAHASNGALQDKKQTPPAGKSATIETPTTPTPSPKVRRPPRGRLPAYFSAVVSQRQRLQIYEIQKQYNDKVATIRLQIHQLLAQRDKEIDAVLTPEQMAQVTERRKAAAARRQSRLQRQADPDQNDR